MKEIEITTKLGNELTADEIQTAAVKALGVSPKIKSQLKYRILRRSIRRPNEASSAAKIARSKEMLVELLSRIDSLEF